MSSLSSKEVHQFWNQYKDKIIYKVVTFMEGVENWVLDNNPDFEKLINELSKELEDISNVDMSQISQEDRIIAIANCLSSGRSLRLLHIIDTAQPGTASKILMYAEEKSASPDDLPGLFLRRNIVFERLRLLSRIFAKERVNMILKALEGE
jgi:intracellular multiplication protein IcmW